MVRHAGVLALVGLVLGTQHTLRAESFKATGERMTHFYLSPTLQDFDTIQKGIKSHLKKFESRDEESGTALMAAVFLARVTEKYHYPLLDIGDLDDTAKSIIAKDASEISNYVNDDSQVDPGKLDLWWVGQLFRDGRNALPRQHSRAGR